MSDVLITAKLNKLKLEHDELKKEYQDIYDSNDSIRKTILLDKMKAIETTFIKLDLNVYRWELKNEKL